MSVIDLQGWTVDVDRGPEWLFLRLHPPHDGLGASETEDFANPVWHAMQQHFAKRVVLEMDLIPRLHSRLIGQLVLLHKRISAADGCLRICGLSAANEAALYATRLSKQLPCYRDRGEAVMPPHRPTQPR